MAFIQRGQDLLSYPPGVNRSEKVGWRERGSDRRRGIKRENNWIPNLCPDSPLPNLSQRTCRAPSFQTLLATWSPAHNFDWHLWGNLLNLISFLSFLFFISFFYESYIWDFRQKRPQNGWKALYAISPHTSLCFSVATQFFFSFSHSVHTCACTHTHTHTLTHIHTRPR